mmetsp:Transcript_49101/g.91489  ORF Transcript_49101/g.91489 Transcript_49101/m.91489 type:complete len:299 (+) Transcript_49101:404-1300(+)
MSDAPSHRPRPNAQHQCDSRDGWAWVCQPCLPALCSKPLTTPSRWRRRGRTRQPPSAPQLIVAVSSPSRRTHAQKQQTEGSQSRTRSAKPVFRRRKAARPCRLQSRKATVNNEPSRGVAATRTVGGPMLTTKAAHPQTHAAQLLGAGRLASRWRRKLASRPRVHPPPSRVVGTRHARPPQPQRQRQRHFSRRPGCEPARSVAEWKGKVARQSKHSPGRRHCRPVSASRPPQARQVLCHVRSLHCQPIRLRGRVSSPSQWSHRDKWGQRLNVRWSKQPPSKPRAPRTLRLKHQRSSCMS